MSYSLFIGKEGDGDGARSCWSIGFTEHSELFSKLNHAKYPLLSQMSDYHKSSIFWGTAVEELLREVDSFLRDEDAVRGSGAESLRLIVAEAGQKGLPLHGRSDDTLAVS